VENLRGRGAENFLHALLQIPHFPTSLQFPFFQERKSNQYEENILYALALE